MFNVAVYLWSLLVAVQYSASLYNESPCSANGGACQFVWNSCSNGRMVSQQCPSQSWLVWCCIPNTIWSSSATTTSTRSCNQLGGTCMDSRECPGLSVTDSCRGHMNPNVRCCIRGLQGVDVIDRHLNKEAGFIRLQGYLPSYESGVHVATEVDLAELDEYSLRLLAIPYRLIYKLRPYLGKKSRSELLAAGLNERNLRLTLMEARQLDYAMKYSIMRRIARYDDNLSVRGQAVLVSLTHWCGGRLEDNIPDGRCYIRTCDNYLRLALVGRRAIDSDLRSALAQQIECARLERRSEATVQRLIREMNYLYPDNGDDGHYYYRDY